MILILTSKFCPYCSNDKAVDGSYQDIGTFAIMEKEATFNDCKVLRVEWVCYECGHCEDCKISDEDKKVMYTKICQGENWKNQQ